MDFFGILLECNQIFYESFTLFVLPLIPLTAGLLGRQAPPLWRQAAALPAPWFRRYVKSFFSIPDILQKDKPEKQEKKSRHFCAICEIFPPIFLDSFPSGIADCGVWYE